MQSEQPHSHTFGALRVRFSPFPKKVPNEVTSRVPSIRRSAGAMGSGDERRDSELTEYFSTSMQAFVTSPLSLFQTRRTSTLDFRSVQSDHCSATSSQAAFPRDFQVSLVAKGPGFGTATDSHSQSTSECACQCQPLPLFVHSKPVIPPAIARRNQRRRRSLPHAFRSGRTLGSL